jgi:hypothetical protein
VSSPYTTLGSTNLPLAQFLTYMTCTRTPNKLAQSCYTCARCLSTSLSTGRIYVLCVRDRSLSLAPACTCRLVHAIPAYGVAARVEDANGGARRTSSGSAQPNLPIQEPTHMATYLLVAVEAIIQRPLPPSTSKLPKPSTLLPPPPPPHPILLQCGATTGATCPLTLDLY